MPIPSGGLINNFDPINPASYPGSGTVWTDPVTSLVMNLYGSPSYDSVQGTFFFNGGSQKAYSAPGSYANLTNTFTVNIWVKITDTSVTQPVWINGWRGGGGFTYNGWVLFYDAGAGKFDFGANGVFGVNTWSPTVVQNQWYFLSFSWNSGTLKAYVNGSLANTYTGLGNANAYTVDSKFGVGHPDNAPNTVKCTVGPIITYNVTLNDTQVNNIYSTYFNRFNPPIVSYDLSNPACYPGSGSVVTNLGTTIGNNNLTLYGSPTFNNVTDSLSFVNGVSEAYSAAGQYASIGSTFTFNYWCKIDNIGVDSTIVLNGSAPPGGPYTGIQLYYQAATQKFGYNFIAVQGSDFTMSNVVQGRWYQVSIVANGSTIKSYVNGVLTDTFSYAAYNSLTSNSQIGFPGGLPLISGGTCSVGLLDIYTQELNQTQITTLYNDNYQRFNPAIHAYDAAIPTSYPGSGTTFYDIGTTSPINLTINNATFDNVNDSFALAGTTSSYIRSAEPVSIGIGGNNFSVQYWFKYNGLTGQPPYNIFLQVGERYAGIFSGFNHNTYNGELIVQKPGVGDYNTGFYPVVNTWYQVTMTVDSSNNMILFINGTNSFSTTTSFVAPSGPYASISIGTPLSTVGDNVGNINIGPIFIYDRVLSSTEVTNYYNSTASRFFPPPPAPAGSVGGRTFGQGFAG